MQIFRDDRAIHSRDLGGGGGGCQIRPPPPPWAMQFQNSPGYIGLIQPMIITKISIIADYLLIFDYVCAKRKEKSHMLHLLFVTAGVR